MAKGLTYVRPTRPPTVWRRQLALRSSRALMLCVRSFHLLQEVVRTLDRRVYRTISGPEMQQQRNDDAGADADNEKRQQDLTRMHGAPPVLRLCIIVECPLIQ